ncbi:MAG: FadR family transcriptional regulator [Bacillaceae bacterium]|nr:FadR family transcriptional regulator [Bacillaceae bacterium]
MAEHSKVKVYQEVLSEIRAFIDRHHLSPGDRLPSERELADQLSAGRSSVREALRAIELLGLIETRQGEGTFLRSYRPYHTVEVLSSFILRESKTRDELIQVKQLLEREGAQMAIGRLTESDFEYLKGLYEQYDQERDFHFEFFLRIFSVIENHLLLKIWQLVEEFSRTVHKIKYSSPIYKELIQALKDKQHYRIQPLMLHLYQESSAITESEG